MNEDQNLQDVETRDEGSGDTAGNGADGRGAHSGIGEETDLRHTDRRLGTGHPVGLKRP